MKESYHMIQPGYVSVLGMYPVKMKTNLKDTCSTIYTTDNWLKKMWQTGLLLGRKKEWNIATGSNMEEPRQHYTQGSQRAMYHLYVEPRE